METELNIIVVGGGWVTNHRHLPALKRSRLFRVLGVVSDDESRARATARRFRLPHYGTRLDFTGWQADSAAVMIGTIPQAHAAVAEQALLAGRHVLCEKPLAVEVEDARRLGELAAERQRVLAVVHNFQFSRAALRLRRRLERGHIGRIRAVYGVQLCNERRNVPGWCHELPLGLFYDEAPHFYYMLRWLGGPDLKLLHASVLPSTGPLNTPRAVTAEYRGSGGVPLYLHINFDSSITEWHVLVVAEQATVDLDIWRDIYTELPNDGAHGPWEIVRTSLYGALYHFSGVATGAWRHLRGRHLYGNEEVVRRFYRAIRGEDCLQGMSARDGLQVVELMHELMARASRHAPPDD